MHSRTIPEIEDLLEAERTALLAGDFSALTDLVERKACLTAELAQAGADRQAVRRLRERAERNAALLEASMRGLRSVSRRVAEIRRANGPLQTYGQNGAQQTLGDSAGTFERRA